MSGRRWFWTVVILGVAAFAVFWWRRATVPSTPASGSSTKLEITVIGGFAFVPSPDRHLEIAYLEDFVLRNDTNGNGVMDPTEPVAFDDVNGNGVKDANEHDTCNIDQIGTELKITRGTIDVSEPVGKQVPAEFNLDKAVVTFPALEAANIALSGGPATWPPSPDVPANTDDEPQWKNHVPILRQHHGGTINPNWRNMVNGRLVLRGGDIKSTFPSNPLLKKANFEFKANNQVKFKAAMTDKMIYTVDVPAGNVEILLSGGSEGFTRLVIKPQGNKVALQLKGKHATATPPALTSGTPLHDFCAFYQLLQPMPPPAEFLLPHYIPDAALLIAQNTSSGGAPTPGFFCPGDWF